jgi:hypothetical protein
MSLDKKEYENTVLTTTIIASVFLIVSIFGALTYYTSTSGQYMANNQPSKDKINMLVSALQTALGNKWPYVILFCLILICFILYLFYLLSINATFTINLSDKGTERFNFILIILTSIFCIFIIVLTVKQFLDYQNKKDNGQVNNYFPTLQQQNKNKDILTIIGLSLFIVLVGGYSLWYIYKNYL